MAQFVAFEPKAEVFGQSLRALTAGLTDDFTSILQKYGFDKIDPEAWYPQQVYLDMLREISSNENSSANLVAVGIQIPEQAAFPPQINNIPTAMMSLETAYHMNHRNGEIGHYHAEVVDDNTIKITAENPYACDFDYGILYGLARRFRPQGAQITVYHDDDAPCRKHGAESCTFRVTWK